MKERNDYSPFAQYERLRALSEILRQADSIGQEQIVRLVVQELFSSGLSYREEKGMITFSVDGQEYRYPAALLFQPGTYWPDKAEQSREEQPEVVDGQPEPFSYQDTISSPWEEEAVIREDTAAEEAAVPSIFEEMMTVEMAPDFLCWGEEEPDSLKEGRTEVDEPEKGFSFLHAEEHSEPPVQALVAETAPSFPEEEESSIAKEASLFPQEEGDAPGKGGTEKAEVPFGRNSVSRYALRRAHILEEEAEEPAEKQKGYEPPLGMDFLPNQSIALQDCVYSMFLGEVCEETSITKNEIYFMVAPFEIKREEASTNILLYAFYKGQNYAVTSLGNREKNSLLCQIAEYQFLVRGCFKNGKWESSIQLTGESLRRKDVLRLTGEYHHNPDTMGETNGHIRFGYQGHINRRDLVSNGCIDIFPMDNSGEDAVIVRCMEDFIDIFYANESDRVILYTGEGDKELTVECRDGVLTAFLAEKQPEPEESELS